VGDDCLAVNGGVTNITLNNVNCVGGHGFSVGSLGKGGATENVNLVRILNSSCTNCQNGVRIKTWPGGKGKVSDVKYIGLSLVNVDNPIVITTHYCDQNQESYCNGNDASSLSITGVTISGITGSVSSAGNPIVDIDCSTNTPCTDFTISGVNVNKASNTKKNVCINLQGSSGFPICFQ
jgi:galacturan 1,4-alpha-galacturonidase